MSVGVPVVGLATTEMVEAIENGRSGFVTTRPHDAREYMKFLLHNPAAARRLGEGARMTVRQRYSIQRFVRDWHNLIMSVCGCSYVAFPVTPEERSAQ